MRKDILIGAGSLIVAGIGQGDNEGIGIYSSPDHGHETNDPIPMKMLDDKEPEIAIWFKDMKAIRMFQDQINGVALRMNGYEIKNKEKVT
ncbi:hypothetical protein LCGC14_0376620 [marine sediment metagenome]|uniref:Uncharacterized protein n=1 Tax=marine sediment metagenome TaxID=412755 RepID=A0A0F9VQQ9_9ZZZZ